MRNGQRTTCGTTKGQGMPDDTLVTLAIVCVLALIIGMNALGFWNIYLRLPTFDEYRHRHPDLV